MTDVLIMGAGAAGLTAAIYACRAGLTAKVFDQNGFGGQIAITYEIENYPAIEKITGPDFSMNLYNQARAQGAQIVEATVEAVSLQGAVKTLVTSKGRHEGRAVIIANGVKRRKLGCEGEEALIGRGVSYCATCDGAFFRGKEVVIVGGGNTALEDALFLSNLCSKVTIIHRRDTFRAEKRLVAAAQSKQNIDILYSHVVTQIDGEQAVTGIKIQQTSGADARTLSVSAVFIAIGLEPDNRLFEGLLPMDAHGYLLTGEDCAAPLPGVYVAGDTRSKLLRQIITAAADGAVAAYGAATYINASLSPGREPEEV